MKPKFVVSIIGITAVVILAFIFYPKALPSKAERTIAYWTDPMIPGDRSDHPGKSSMGMERVPVYADEEKTEFVGRESNEKNKYYCPMHSQVTSDKPGACSICGMTLVKRQTEKILHNVNTVTISPEKQVLANVSTSIAKKMSLEKEIRAAGTIEYAEPLFRHISTRFPGRIEKLYLTYTGQKIRKGDPVADLYSPEAISAQQEYLLAKDSYNQVKDSPAIVTDGALALLEQSKQKLLLWGFTDLQREELERSNKAKNIVTIYSPISGTVVKKNVDPQHYSQAGEDIYDVADLSTVWMYADLYEFEMKSLKIGDALEATSDAYPGESFRGSISFISPTIDPSSRTVRVRADVPNSQDKLKPDMFVNVMLKIKLPKTVTVPSSAILATGNRQIVWVQKEPGMFEPRQVKIGTRTEQFVQIIDGINEGEVVVTSGGYLIDSESQLTIGE